MKEITLERWAQLEEIIKTNINWAAYRRRIDFLFKLYRAGTLDAPQYLDQSERSLLSFAGVTE